MRKEASRQGFQRWCPSPPSTYQHAFDGEILQASVPWGVKDHGQRFVWGLDVADLHLIL